jgi:hypothetical protein
VWDRKKKKKKKVLLTSALKVMFKEVFNASTLWKIVKI